MFQDILNFFTFILCVLFSGLFNLYYSNSFLFFTLSHVSDYWKAESYIKLKRISQNYDNLFLKRMRHISKKEWITFLVVYVFQIQFKLVIIFILFYQRLYWLSFLNRSLVLLTSSWSTESLSTWYVTYTAISFNRSDDATKSPDRNRLLPFVWFSKLSSRIIVSTLSPYNSLEDYNKIKIRFKYFIIQITGLRLKFWLED